MRAVKKKDLTGAISQWALLPSYPTNLPNSVTDVFERNVAGLSIGLFRFPQRLLAQIPYSGQ